MRAFAMAAALTMTSLSAMAADMPVRKSAPVAPAPVSACAEPEGVPTDAFGFTTGSDVADPGSLGASLTYGGAYGARGGAFASHGATAQLSYGVLPCLEVGPYVFGNLTNASFGGVSADSRGYGAGIEMKYKLLTRGAHGVGVTAVIDPSAGRTWLEGVPGFTGYNTGLRLFIDKALIPGRLYGALNFSHDLTWTGPSPYLRSSTFSVGAALAVQVVEGFYVSGEVRHQRRYANLGFGNEAGYATFAGPGVFWQVNQRLALSAAYNIQVAGRAKGVPGNLDLTNFNHHLVKVKAAISF